ncbi:hypothetical protein AB0758_44165 [Tolypothrix bouteillei VB521301_2]|uniref:hypothetical protein n=1 Tax=Tolypothrix bouteillei TaxID=1246981 RepID=UPI0038B48A04
MNGSTNKVNHIMASTIEAGSSQFHRSPSLEPNYNRYISAPVQGGNNLTISDDPHKIPPIPMLPATVLILGKQLHQEKTGRRGTGARPKKKESNLSPKQKIRSTANSFQYKVGVVVPASHGCATSQKNRELHPESPV